LLFLSFFLCVPVLIFQPKIGTLESLEDDLEKCSATASIFASLVVSLISKLFGLISREHSLELRHYLQSLIKLFMRLENAISQTHNRSSEAHLIYCCGSTHLCELFQFLAKSKVEFITSMDNMEESLSKLVKGNFFCIGFIN
jgi:hypothetical protein